MLDRQNLLKRTICQFVAVFAFKYGMKFLATLRHLKIGYCLQFFLKQIVYCFERCATAYKWYL